MSAPERRDPQDAVFAPEELLRALPTPCYVYDEAQLRTRAARLRSAFSWSAGFRAWFPVRALPNPTVLRILREEGQGALCVTAGEYRLALASGFSPESIRFAPEFPTDAELAVPAADLVLDDGGLLLRLERERPLPARRRCMTASACRCPIAASAAVSRWPIAARSATPTSRPSPVGYRRNFPGSWSLPVWAACPWRRVLAAGSRPMQASCLQR